MYTYEEILNWIIYTGGVQPVFDNHFGTDPDATPKLNLHLQQRPSEIATLISFLLERKNQGESLNYYGEIGACSGGTSYAINHFLNFEELLIIDDNGKQAPDFYIDQRRNLDRHHILKWIPRVEIIGSSNEQRVIDKARQLTNLKKLDVLLIDGDHSYEGVKNDTLNYIDFVRDGGYILYHDTAHLDGLIMWMKEITAVVPRLRHIKTIQLNGLPLTPIFPKGIGIDIFQKQ